MTTTIIAESLLPRPKLDCDGGYDVAMKGASVVVHDGGGEGKKEVAADVVGSRRSSTARRWSVTVFRGAAVNGHGLEVEEKRMSVRS